ncbi:TPA: hypothetical protein DEB02_02220, partial [Candidatus Beckwithbacteria bacterium]|nr:hypothetical protein [Candidatus Beckwithbacteria bacterium]
MISNKFFYWLIFSLLFLLLPQTALALGMTELGVVTTSDTVNNSYFGSNNVMAADLNGDGYQDLIATAPQAASGKGKIYIFYGGATFDDTVDLTITNSGTGSMGDNLIQVNNYKATDIDGDGADDLIIGSASNDDGALNAGEVYIIFGSSSLASSIDAATEADITITNTTANDLFGSTITTGDFNADGNQDIAFAAQGASSSAGDVRVFYGDGDQTFDTTADVTLAVAGSDKLGQDLLVSGDVNGDGADDILVGEDYSDQATIHIFYGGSSMNGDVDITITGETTTENFTRSSGETGDINQDGKADFCLGAYLNDTSATNAGRVYCFLGSSSLSATYDATDADIIFSGAAANDNFGRELAMHDVNSDGNTDLIVGAYQIDGSDEGQFHIFLSDGTTIDTTADLTFTSADLATPTTNQNLGHVVWFGDMDNDGWQEVFVSSIYGGNGTGVAGQVYAFEITHGSPAITLIDTTITEDTTPQLTGTVSDGVAVSGVQWSTSSTTTGTWNSCSATDGSFDGSPEGFSCDLSSLSAGAHTIYV